MPKRKDDLKVEGKLTPKMERFARIYSTSDGNGTASAITAGYAVQGAHVTASRLLRLPKVTKAIAKYRARTAERLDISREKLLNDSAHDAEQASSKGDYNAANSARTLISRIQGYIIDRSISATVDLTAQHIEALRRIVQGNGQQSQVTAASDQDQSQVSASAGSNSSPADLELTAEAVLGDEDK
jgi:phage terminase small subunit